MNIKSLVLSYFSLFLYVYYNNVCICSIRLYRHGRESSMSTFPVLWLIFKHILQLQWYLNYVTNQNFSWYNWFNKETCRTYNNLKNLLKTERHLMNLFNSSLNFRKSIKVNNTITLIFAIQKLCYKIHMRFADALACLAAKWVQSVVVFDDLLNV